MFITPPRTKAQRDRRLALIEMVQEGTYHTYGELMEGMKEIGAWDYGNDMTLIDDMKACNIAKFKGVYVHMPHTDDENLIKILSSRMRVAAEQVFRHGDIVVVNTNQYASAWVSHPLKEMNHEHVLSISCTEFSFWVLCEQGSGRKVEAWMQNLWRSD